MPTPQVLAGVRAASGNGAAGVLAPGASLPGCVPTCVSARLSDSSLSSACAAACGSSTAGVPSGLVAMGWMYFTCERGWGLGVGGWT